MARQRSFPSRPGRRRFGELAVGTAADCTAVCCCGPCVVAKLLVMALYDLPCRVCRKARRRMTNRRKKNQMKKIGIGKRQPSISGGSLTFDESNKGGFGAMIIDRGGSEAAAADFEAEMWQLFRGGGFWRSLSQRDI
ncbi:uncharacterized protein LOC127788741 [Diospyros lotus]|uniref:uncharacterized protein LOC127788741 n=1 Tax=Diospyros lotus TaxID=55363 RepID=UPI0022597651|nr:uncharacterized protein LOC127788741 [Diospyros lotus]